MHYSCQKSILGKNPVFPIEKFLSLALLRNTMFQHLIQFLFDYMSTGHLQEVKNKRKFQIFSSKSGHSRLRELWSLTRAFRYSDLTRKVWCNFWKTARCGEVVATRDFTVISTSKFFQKLKVQFHMDLSSIQNKFARMSFSKS